jgi:hypothetical protein
LPSELLARVYATGRAVDLVRARLPLLPATGSRPDWIAASLVTEGDALRIRLAKVPAGTAVDPSLLGQVPSGAILAFSFQGAPGAAAQLRRVTGGRLLGLGPAGLAALVSGPGVVYVRAGSAILPVFGAELRPKDPEAAVAALGRIAARVQRKSGGALVLVVRRDGGRIFVADSQAAIDDLRGSGPKLVDDPPFKDAVAAAGGGTPLLYADVQQLLPLVQLAGGILGVHLPKAVGDSLAFAGTVVAVARQSGGVAQLEVRIAKR